MNNGFSAYARMIGKEEKIKSKNNNSNLTFKIQVEKIKELIDMYEVK